MPLDLSRPLSLDEGKAFQDLIHRLPWERNLSPYFLAGWCLTAGVCGALAWRPHIWLSGPAGSGKTWIMTHILKPAVGDMGLHVQFETSEAGLRQELMRDARPVLFDEAEGETERAALRMQNIMGLMRQASSENGARIIKGSAGGAAMSFSIRAQFAFASISPGLVQQADETRVTPLMVAKRHDPEGFTEIKRIHRELVTEDFAERLLARALVVLPRMADTVEIFSRAIGDRLNSQRIADQAGTLLAGAWLLQRDELPTSEQALAMVAAGDWGEEEITGEETDDRKLLRRLTQWEVRVDGEQHTGHTITIGELILLASGQGDHRDISPTTAGHVLRRYGIKVDGAGFAVSAKSEAIRERLKGTPWYVGWHRTLKSLPGTTDFNKVHKFQAGSPSQRSITVPITALE